MSQEQLLLKSRVQTLDDALNAHSLETKASRETIMRLVSEVGKEQKNIDEISNALERAKLASIFDFAVSSYNENLVIAGKSVHKILKQLKNENLVLRVGAMLQREVASL